MSVVNKTDNSSIEVVIKVKIQDHHVSFAKDVKAKMDHIAAIKYLHHTYPMFSLFVCKEIVEHFLD